LGNPEQYQVVIHGDVLEGWDAEQVIAAFASLSGLDLDKARLYFQGNPVVVKKCEERDTAASWHRKLSDMGINTSVARIAGEAEPAANSGTVSPSPEVEAISESAASSATEPPAPVVEATSEPAEVDPEPEHSHSRPATLKSYFVAVGAAVLCGFLWQQLALTLDYELGIVAWLVGAAVGLAGALAGSRGVLAGITCAVLVLIAIAAGKYLTYYAYQERLAFAWGEQGVWAGEEGRARFEKIQVDAELLLELDGSDTALRYFVFERNYSDAPDLADVTDGDVAEFHKSDETDLSWISTEDPSFDQWRLRMKSKIAKFPPLHLLVDKLGVLDAIFLLLGLITAYRLGARGLSGSA
jgi:hypothetical protein